MPIRVAVEVFVSWWVPESHRDKSVPADAAAVPADISAPADISVPADIKPATTRMSIPVQKWCTQDQRWHRRVDPTWLHCPVLATTTHQCAIRTRSVAVMLSEEKVRVLRTWGGHIVMVILRELDTVILRELDMVLRELDMVILRELDLSLIHI